MMSQSAAVKVARLMEKARHLVVLTGAGISTKAGIPDFRGPRGLYVTRRYDPEKVFDIHSFHKDPKPFFDFARDFLMMVENIRPTLTHQCLAAWERRGTLRGIITQNIDGLHQKAGSRDVIELHGSFLTSTCEKCHRRYSLAQMKEIILTQDIPWCSCGGVIKPDIVFFGENVKDFEKAVAWSQQADLFMILGSSCVVYPAASLPQWTYCPVIAVNQGEVALTDLKEILSFDTDTDDFFKDLEGYLPA